MRDLHVYDLNSQAPTAQLNLQIKLVQSISSPLARSLGNFCQATVTFLGVDCDAADPTYLESRTVLDAINSLRTEFQKERAKYAADVDALHRELHNAHLKRFTEFRYDAAHQF